MPCLFIFLRRRRQTRERNRTNYELPSLFLLVNKSEVTGFLFINTSGSKYGSSGEQKYYTKLNKSVICNIFFNSSFSFLFELTGKFAARYCKMLTCVVNSPFAFRDARILYAAYERKGLLIKTPVC